MLESDREARVVDQVDDRHLTWLVVIHFTFVSSGVMLALMDWLAAKTDKH